MQDVFFTGTQHFSKDDEWLGNYVLDQLDPKQHRLITGGCVGWDEFIATEGTKRGFTVHTVMPANRGKVDKQWKEHCTTFEEMPEGSTYRDRNTRMVELGEWGIACAQYPENHPMSKRSGTWMTVRIALKAGKHVAEYVING